MSGETTRRTGSLAAMEDENLLDLTIDGRTLHDLTIGEVNAVLLEYVVGYDQAQKDAR